MHKQLSTSLCNAHNYDGAEREREREREFMDGVKKSALNGDHHFSSSS